LVGAIGVGLAGAMLPAFSRAKSKRLAAYAPVSSGIIPSSSDLATTASADRYEPQSARGVYSAGAVGYVIVTNSVLDSRDSTVGRSPVNAAPDQAASRRPVSPRPQPVPASLPRSGSFAFKVEGDAKGQKAGQMLADFGRVSAGESAPLPSVHFDGQGVAAESGVMPQQQGGVAGKTWAFSGKAPNGRLDEPVANAGAIDNLSSINGPMATDGGKNAGTIRYFRDLQVADTFSDATSATGGRALDVSGSTRGFYDRIREPDSIGVLESKKSDAEVPVLGDLPVLGRLFKEPPTAGVPVVEREPALATFQSQNQWGDKSELAPNQTDVRPGLATSATKEPLQRFGGFAGGGGGAGGGLGGAGRAAGEFTPVPPADVTIREKLADAGQTDGDQFNRNGAMIASRRAASAAGASGTPAAEGRVDLFAKTDAKQAGDESRFGLKTGLEQNENLAFGSSLSAIVPATPPVNQLAGESPVRARELTEGVKRQVSLGIAVDDIEESKRVVSELKLRIEQEKIDMQMPMESVVTIHDLASAEDSKNKGLLAKLGDAISGQKDAVARISVDKDKRDVEGLNTDRSAAGYDPFFLQTEFEKITSQRVLDQVVDKLELEKTFAKEQGLDRELSREQTRKLLKDRVSVELNRGGGLLDIRAKAADSKEAALIANTVAEVYRDSGLQQQREIKTKGIEILEKQLAEREVELAKAQTAMKKLPALQERLADDVAPAKPTASAPVPQPEVLAAENAFSTFSLNVSDVSFKLATASLERGKMPEPASIRSEEFINAFDYRDPAPTAGAPLAFAWDRARLPFEHNRDLLRLSVETAAAGRSAGQPLNLVVLLDNSGSMERADRVRIRREALRVLATQLRPQDRLSVVTFARTAHLRADGVSGDQAATVFDQLDGVTPEGGTNLEEAMGLAYQTAQRHLLANGVNRVVMLTDGAANLGNVDPESLKKTVESNRRQGVALDCFGVGWEGLNDDLLETLSRNGDGRYGFLNSPEEAASGFAQQLAGALQVAASDVKVQVEFNPKRVTTYRQIGYAKHQLTKEQFRDNTVDAAEIGAAEAGNALYTMEVNPQGEGPLATVRVRFKVPGTQDYREHAWEVPFNGAAPALEYAAPAMRLAATAAEFAEWLSDSPFAGEVSPDALRKILVGVPEFYGTNSRAKQLAEAVEAASRLTGK
jgi:Mg-chelatase subunit ChlD